MHIRLGEALLLICLLSWPCCSATHQVYRRPSTSYHTGAIYNLHRHCRLGYTHGMLFF